MELFKKILALVCLLVVSATLISCTHSTDDVVAGGSAIRYSYCVFNNTSQLASIPIIIKDTIDSAKLTSVDMDYPDIFSISQEVLDLDDSFNYKGYNVYFLVLKIRCISMDSIVSAKVKSLTLDINGEDVIIQTPYFNICNGVDGISSEFYNDGTLLFGGTGFNTLVASAMPSRERPAVVGMVNKSAIEISGFYLLDYLLIDEFEFNMVDCDPSSINKAVRPESNMEFIYSLKYAKNCGNTNIIRVARIVVFNESGIKHAFIDGAGAYIYLGYQDQRAVKNYIDSL